ncbi:EAL domain-containing response regulator [Yunchengibacter salinarum]|uniref:EAL domain-containing response regulator n=1 Tax=Yunchengibacter salinarum TaxID=3133399 RepID=UPI0035B5A176
MDTHILVVDATGTLRDAAHRASSQHGTPIAHAATLDQAVEVLATEHYDALLVHMGALGADLESGLQALARGGKGASVVLVSDGDPARLAHAEDMALAYSINLLGHLEPPLNANDLTDLLAGIMDRRVGGDSPVLMETEFVRGLMTDGLTPLLQPRLDLADNRVSSFEVLARWRSPRGALLGAGAVLKLALEKGYMDVLTYRMLELAAEVQGRWAGEGVSVPLSVNVDNRNLAKPDFADVVASLASQFDVPPALLRLEVQDSSLDLDHPPIDAIKDLYDRGFSLALDDFGGGFATLITLADIPFQALLVDRAFIRAATGSDRARMVLECAVELGRRLGLSVVAEGVESADQLALVREAGFSHAQGYLIAPPMPVEKARAYLDDPHPIP